MSKSILQQAAAAKAEKEASGYIGARVSPELEKAFKAYCKTLGLSMADALRALIAAELKQAPGAVPSVSPAISAPAPVSNSLPNKNQKNTSRVSAKGDLNNYLVNDAGGAKLLPCPLCGRFFQYSTFKSRHTKRHGYADTLAMFHDHADRVTDMLAEFKKDQ